MTDAIVVLITAPTAEKGAEILRTLVEEGLAAGGSVIPGLRSIYRWEGKIWDEPEVMLVLQSRATLFEALRERVVSLHPYKCPEILQLGVEEGHPPYLEWIRASVRPTV